MTTSAAVLPQRGPLPSASAHQVARIRARLTRPCTPVGDPEAEDRLYAALAAERTPFERFIAARTEFFDTELLSALRGGAAQVVILGAGYDGRALRFRSPGVRYIEVDLPATQADKLRRLEALGIDVADIEFTAADLAAAHVPDVLRQTSFEPRQTSLFCCEGVLPYLSYQAASAILGGIRDCAGPGSRLILSFPVALGQALPRTARPNQSGEYRRTFYTPGGVAKILADRGWVPRTADHPDHSLPLERDIAMFLRAVPGHLG